MPQQRNVDIHSRAYPGGRSQRGGQEFISALKGLYALFEPLTMASVAVRTGVSEASISHWLRGRRTPKPDTLARFHAEASKAAAARDRSAPPPLNQLLRLRHESLYTPWTCRDEQAATTLACQEGDRRNDVGAAPGHRGDRRNEEQHNPPLATSTPERIFEMSGSANRGEGFQVFQKMACSLPVPDLLSVATALLKNGQDITARDLLLEASGKRREMLVEMLLINLRANAGVQI